MSDMEAEAKLFNQIVAEEEHESNQIDTTPSDDKLSFGRIVGGDEIIPYNFLFFGLNSNPDEHVINTDDEQNEYDKFVTEYYNFWYNIHGNKHPYSKEEPILGTPDTFNTIIEKRIEKDRKQKQNKDY